MALTRCVLCAMLVIARLYNNLHVPRMKGECSNVLQSRPYHGRGGGRGGGMVVWDEIGTLTTSLQRQSCGDT